MTIIISTLVADSLPLTFSLLFLFNIVSGFLCFPDVTFWAPKTSVILFNERTVTYPKTLKEVLYNWRVVSALFIYFIKLYTFTSHVLSYGKECISSYGKALSEIA